MLFKKSVGLVIACSFNLMFSADTQEQCRRKLEDWASKANRLIIERETFCSNFKSDSMVMPSSQTSSLSSWFSLAAWKSWAYNKLPYAKPTTQASIENFDKHILLLCLTFDEDNLPIIQQELEAHPEFDINKNLDTDICGGVTLMHANLWFWRSYYATPENRPVFLNTMQLLLDRNTDPDVSTPYCMINDTETKLISAFVINNAYQHALFCGENELVQSFDMQRKKLGHVLKPQSMLVGFNSAGALFMTGIQRDFDATVYDNQIQVVSAQCGEQDPVAQEVYNCAIQYKKENLPTIQALLGTVKDINGAFKPGLTLAHALLCHWRNENINKDDSTHDVFIETQKLCMQSGAQPYIELPLCTIEDKPTRSQHQDVFNSLYKHALLAGDKQLYTLFPKNDDAKMITFLLTWHVDTDAIRWSTKRVEI